MSETSSIDDLLTGVTPAASEPDTSEHAEAPEHDYSEPEQDSYSDEETEGAEQEELSHDDYGNEKPKSRTYTEDEVNERINKAVRERLARGNQQQPTRQQEQEAAKLGFEYNDNSDVPWQQQLEQFVEQTFHKINQKQAQEAVRQKEVAAENEFRDRFSQGMDRFSDFVEVVSQQPMTDYMTIALRGVKDPAAFVYAASKRAPAELQRISQLQDPYAQIVEMGKLEERMRKAPQQTNAPRPVSRSTDDGKTPLTTKRREPTIEDLIAHSDKQRQQMLNKRRGR